MKLFRVSRNYLPSWSTWPDWFHAKKCCLSLGLKVDGWIINKQQTMLGKESEQITECVFESLRNCADSLCSLFFFFFYILHIFQRDSVSVEVGQDFLCNMLYNCINNKSEKIWVVNICILFKWDRTESTFCIERRPCLLVNMQRAGSSCSLLSITATCSCGNVERRERFTNCQANRNWLKWLKQL